ncbi:DUF1772 domain-containing protein [Actinomadura alba]|uniref:DUF1772 domain-containing protein n=1 Tax=Actinomadura alba TaxID=406431 RepID=A0ABR7M1X7_9ACTN|nr:anthrone oxygenase family protein [Actinomadura alba]MBC6470804.1 DUF1772 domain-containing protein [Actinomadura alba]
MLDQFRGVSLVAATIAMGLAAGLYYAYACSVMLGLGKADDRTFVEGMQKINVAILNGWFFLTFAGALLLTAVAAVLHFRGDGGRAAFAWIVAALVLYVVVLIVTMGFNVPLNDRLEAAGDPARIADLAAVRENFEAAWVRWNIVRTLACTAAFGCLTWALVLYGRSGS